MIKMGYRLSNGQVVEYYPEFFAERATMVEEAKSIAANLKYTKKLSGKEFSEVWRNDPQVKRYRELLRQIWTFEASAYVVSREHICDKHTDECSGELSKVKRTFDQKWVDYYLVCKVHLEKMLERERNDWTTFEVEIFTEK